MMSHRMALMLSLVLGSAVLAFACVGEEPAPAGGVLPGGDGGPGSSGGEGSAPDTPRISVTVPAEAIVPRATSVTLRVDVTRTGGAAGPITVTLATPPAGITAIAGEIVVPPGESSASFSLQGMAAASQVTGRVKVEAKGEGGLAASAELSITLRGKPGEIDETFGDRGTFIIDSLRRAAGLVGDSANQLYVLYSDGGKACEVQRVTPRGTVDGTWGEGGAIVARRTKDFQCTTLAIQPDGKIVLGGIENASDDRLTIALRAGTVKTADSFIDGTFGGGLVTLPELEGALPNLVLDRMARIVIAGGEPAPRVRRLTTTGVVDPGFTAPALVGKYSPGQIAVGSDDAVYVATGEDVGMDVTRLLPTGVPDPAFGSGGKVKLPNFGSLSPYPTGIAVDGEGRIVVTAGAVIAATKRIGLIARVSKAGVFDLVFGGGDGYHDLEHPSDDISVVGAPIDAQGRAYAVWYQSTGDVNPTSKVGLIRLDDRGIESSFGDFGSVSVLDAFQGSANVLPAILQDERVVVGVNLRGSSSSVRLYRFWR
jgi:hypothetical protein